MIRSVAAMVSVLALSSGCKKSPPAAPPTKTEPAAIAPAAKPSSETPPPADSLWLHVVAVETTWTLPYEDPEKGAPPELVEVKLVKRRVVGKAVIAELEWAHVQGGKRLAMTGYRVPSMIVADGNGVVLHELGSDSRDKTDAELAHEVANEPSHGDPPKEHLEYTDSGSVYVEVKKHKNGPVYCLSEGPPDEEDFQCDDTCYAAVCFSKKDGIVQLNGNFAPEGSHFSAAGYRD